MLLETQNWDVSSVESSSVPREGFWHKKCKNICPGTVKNLRWYSEMEQGLVPGMKF